MLFSNININMDFIYFGEIFNSHIWILENDFVLFMCLFVL